MIRKVVNSKDISSHSTEMKHLRLISVAMILLGVCLAFVGAAGAAESVAEIEGKGLFTSIQAAVEAAANGETILVTKSHNLLGRSEVQKADGKYNVWILVENKDITIDLNGKTVTADYSNGNWDTYKDSITAIIWVHSDAKLTLTDSSEDKTGALKVIATDANDDRVKNEEGKDIYKVNYMLVNYNGDNHETEGGHSLVINGGTYEYDYGKYEGAIIYSQNGKTTLITGGTFKMGNVGMFDASGNYCPWILNGAYNDANPIVVTGGTFNTDVNHQHWEYEVYVPKEYALHNNGDGTWTIVDAVAYVSEYEYAKDLSKKYVRNVGYATVEEAVSNVGKYHDTTNNPPEQYTVTLIKDAYVTETLRFDSIEKPAVFNMNGNKIIWKGNKDTSILTVSENTLTINSFDIEWEGHDINKWKKDGTEYDELPEGGIPSVEVRQSLSVAKSELNTYTITFDTNGGSTVGAITQNYGTEITVPANPTKTGYTFSDWNPEIPATMPAKYMTVTAQWVANTSTVTFDAGEGTVDEHTKTVTFDQPYGELPTPTREGYEFDGWYLNDNQIRAETQVNVDGDHTLTAVWKKIEKPADEDIRHSSSGGSSSGSYLSFPRFTENGGLVDFGSSKVVKALMLPEGSSGSVVLKVDSIEHYPKALETEYTFDISVEKLGEGRAYILFEIPLSKLENFGLTPADICAYHLVDNVWVKLETTYEVKDGTVFYEAATDSFSPFKLVIEEGAATPKAEENEPTVPPTEKPEDKPQEELPPIEPTVQPTEPESPAPILAVLAGLGAVAVLRRE